MDIDRRRSASLLLRGLGTSVGGNAQAFGFSITVTVSYGMLSATSAKPTVPEVFAFALSAVAAFSLLNLVVATFLSDAQAEGQPQRVVLVATATDFLAVGAALAAVLGIRALLDGWPLWAVAPFTAGFVYVVVQSLELTVGQEGDDGGKG